MNRNKPTWHDPDAFPAFQLFILAIVRLAEPIALTSIFPYAWAQVRHFDLGDESDASFYAGVLISSFSLAEAVMGMYWGAVSDRIGRKPVLLLGCVGTLLSLLVVGTARSMWVAVAGRLLGGLLNGNIGVIQTMVGELVRKPEQEPRAYAIMPFVWSVGTILGPAIGGTFADPHRAFPDVFPAESLFARFPYLLPNLLCALLLLVSIVLGCFLLEETHPLHRRRPQVPQKSSTLRDYCCDRDEGPTRCRPYGEDETQLLLATADARKRPPAIDFRAEPYGSTRCPATAGDDAATETEKAPAADSVFTRRILAVILALALFTYHSMAYDATLPIFLEDDRLVPFPDGVSLASLFRAPLHAPGGLGLSLRAVGLVMAVNGALALFVQAVVFPLAAAWLGVWRLFAAVSVLHPLAFVLVPALLRVPAARLYPALYACLAVRNLLGILAYPLLLILLQRAASPPGGSSSGGGGGGGAASALGRINGLAASAGAACRMVAPPVAGYLYTVGRRVDCTALAWYGAALVAVVGAVQCFAVARPATEEGGGEDMV